MNWQSLEHFLHMGGYGLYVWGSYAITLLVMLGEVLLARRRRRQALAEIHSSWTIDNSMDQSMETNR